MTLRLCLAVMLLLCAGWTTRASAEAPANAPALWRGLSPGRHAVGFDLAWANDVSRPGWGGSADGRPLQIWTWYPARRGSGAPMTLGDYAALATATGIAPSGWPKDPAAVFAIGGDPLPKNDLERLRSLPVAARLGYRRATGRFPLIVLAQGFNYESPIHHHVLAEYLASHGYVVVAVPLTGAAGLKPGINAEDFEAQVRDVDYLIQRFRRSPAVDPDRIGLFGFDLGGMAAVAVGAGRSDIDAVAGFDSGVISPRLVEQLLASRAGFSFEGFRPPYLHATRPAQENIARKLDETLAIFQSAPAERVLVRVPGMRHADFTFAGALEGVYPHFWGQVEADPSPKYAALLELTRAFSDRHLKKSKTPLSERPPLVVQTSFP